MADLTLTFGVMPTREQYDAQCALVDPDNGRSVDDDGFGFGNDKRMGTDRLTSAELWAELVKAQAEHEAGDEAAGDWCSSVLGCLGIEWV